ncbi:hypothetical protein TNCT_650651 [Trichonephila clavata]|uniref:Uncharacterized protein n=1 Tax=Trichonephila clavata TaxID=2740835 RepID=A0A8X6IG08_TRICU|nr:hypothetical protein TNCT_650651 [Trichonephila clavata]
MAACRRKRMVTPDEIEKILINKEFPDANTDDEDGNNLQKHGLARDGEKTMVKNSINVTNENISIEIGLKVSCEGFQAGRILSE